jgi:hypothetical protein
MIGRQDAHSIATLKLYFKKGVGWLEVTKARQLNSGDDRQNKYAHRWVFEVGASSDDNTLGIMTEERPSLSIQMQIRRHNASHDSILHSTDYWDGAGTNQYSQPMIMIKAIA